MLSPQQKLLLKILTFKKPTIDKLRKVKAGFAKVNKCRMPTNAELLFIYREMLNKKLIQASPIIENLFKKRAIRTLSGVAPIAVLTKPYACPGKCIFCPTQKAMPKSYLSNEPAVMRAVMNKFDPFKQVNMRIRALTNNGHTTDKIELIVMGGTFNYFDRRYQNWFIKRCFDACNGKTAKTLLEAQKKNETAKHRIIGLTLETRPDYINEEELKHFRELGCTKIEVGVQAINDKILKHCHRGHSVEEIIKATKLMKDFGFKIAYHLMPNLPLATPAKDLAMYKKLFSSPDFQPDMIKIYPTVVTKNSVLYNHWKKGQYKPYSDKQLFELLVKMKLATPNYVRIIRLIRDIPQESIEAGNLITNLRQILGDHFTKNDLICHCIRCREARENTKNAHKARLYIKKYSASEGTEYFLHFSSSNKKVLYAFLRLRLPKKNNGLLPELNNAALIREVHTYGRMAPIKAINSGEIQHRGLGRRMMAKAEEIARQAGYDKMTVISGIGVRGYYRLLGYKKAGTYMSKDISE